MITGIILNTIESKQYCEGLEAEFVSLSADIEKLDKRNEGLLQVLVVCDILFPQLAPHVDLTMVLCVLY